MTPTSPAVPPAHPRPAATVAVLRDGTDGVDVWLMRRHSTMAFAAGMRAFPGGAVEPVDSDPSLPWVGGDVGQLAGRMRVELDMARSLVSAAVRETFEECGLVVARGGGLTEADRQQLLEGTVSWPVLLRDRSVELDADLLAPWSRWVTPDFAPRRFDAYFFVAALPEGQQPRWIDGEADLAEWVPVRRAVAEFDAGTLPMLPPTIETLRDLAEHADVASVFASAPKLIREESG